VKVEDMAQEPEESQSRAKELREEIDRILHPDQKDGRTKSAVPEPANPEKAPSPRDFIQKRMREIDGSKAKT